MPAGEKPFLLTSFSIDVLAIDESEAVSLAGDVEGSVGEDVSASSPSGVRERFIFLENFFFCSAVRPSSVVRVNSKGVMYRCVR